jgi:hypothetical protein
LDIEVHSIIAVPLIITPLSRYTLYVLRVYNITIRNRTSIFHHPNIILPTTQTNPYTAAPQLYRYIGVKHPRYQPPLNRKKRTQLKAATHAHEETTISEMGLQSGVISFTGKAKLRPEERVRGLCEGGGRMEGVDALPLSYGDGLS